MRKNLNPFIESPRVCFLKSAGSRAAGKTLLFPVQPQPLNINNDKDAFLTKAELRVGVSPYITSSEEIMYHHED